MIFDKYWSQKWRQLLLGKGLQQKQRTRYLSMSEIMTLLIAFQQNHYRDFNHFYQKHMCQYWHKEFPKPKLKQVCRVYGSSNDATLHIPETLFWRMYRY
ncbi:hypothetical protein HC246_15305 [Pseudanabaena yagii GIHE-NHR1]|uniref:Transposase n=1 Tax=Pseudanabaena yagii GIHE-NHR1 TaxID=2722753 RepID=A0ABX1LT66_9CYAN|nr:hypothetical protein [Pseudanabaena yagii]NMF59348.1 hypothetical protein [Pseudanabaena yagii GIHE-NHR1]